MKIDKNYYASLIRDSEMLRIIKSLIATSKYVDMKTLCAILGTASTDLWEGNFPNCDLPWTIPEGEENNEQ